MLMLIASGNLGRDPERVAGGPVKFSLACSRAYKKASGEKVEETEWVRCTVWGKLADVVEAHLKKGRFVEVVGRPKSSEYEKDGVKHRGWECIVSEVHFVPDGRGKRDEAPAEAGEPESAPVPEPAAKPADDDIPF